MEENAKLTKKEKKLLRKEEQQREVTSTQKVKKVRNAAIIFVVAALILGAFWWLFKESSKPLPGSSIVQQERAPHISEGETYTYNSNPPTSGKHYDNWTKAGIFETPIADGLLVHSLEHGYIIISYNCEVAQSASEPKQDSGPAKNEALTVSAGAQLAGAAWSEKQCTDLKKQLADYANSKRLWKLIVVPRPNLDAEIALTAWGRLDKMNTFNNLRADQFIDAFRDQGPEKTME